MSTREAERAYTIAEAAEVKSVSQNTIRRAIHAVEAPFLKAKRLKNGYYRISAGELDRWFESLPDG